MKEVILGKLKHERTTPGTYLYKGEDANGRAISQYVPKTALAGHDMPDEIAVVIRFDETE